MPEAERGTLLPAGLFSPVGLPAAGGLWSCRRLDLPARADDGDGLVVVDRDRGPWPAGWAGVPVVPGGASLVAVGQHDERDQAQSGGGGDESRILRVVQGLQVRAGQ